MKVRRISGRGPVQTFRVAVPGERLEALKDRRLAEMAREANIDGFRKGKVPMTFVRHRYGSTVESDLASEFLQSAVDQVRRERRMLLLDVVHDRLPDRPPGAALTFDFTLHGVREFKVPRYDRWKLDVPVADVSEADVDRYLARLKWRVRERGRLEADQRADAEDQVVLTISDRTRPSDPKRLLPSPRVSPAEFRELWGPSADLVGIRVDEDRTFRVKPPEGNRFRRVRTLGVVARAIYRCSPASEEDLRAHFRCETGADLRAHVKATMERFGKRVSDHARAVRVVEKLARSSRIRLPGPSVDQLAKAYGTGEQPPMFPSERFGSFKQLARMNAAANLVLTQIGRERSIEVEVEEVVGVMARGRNLLDVAVRKDIESALQDRELTEHVAAQVRKEKALAHAMAATTWRERRVTFDVLWRRDLTLGHPTLVARTSVRAVPAGPVGGGPRS